MNRIAVMVDAGYLFAAGSALVTGSGAVARHRTTIQEKETIAALKKVAEKVASGTPVLRVYWYDGASRSGPSVEHVRLAHCDDVKVRLGFINAQGQQKGVDSLIVTDLVELARNHAITDALVLSGDEDIRIGVQLAQSYGVRVHLLGISPSRGTQSIQLMQEADTCSEWDAAVLKKIIHLKPEVSKDVGSAGRSVEAAPAIAKQPPAREVASAAKASVGSAALPILSKIAIELAKSTKDGERTAVVQHMAINNKNIPPEYDGKLLAKGREALKRQLDIEEKKAIRQAFRLAMEEK